MAFRSSGSSRPLVLFLDYDIGTVSVTRIKYIIKDLPSMFFSRDGSSDKKMAKVQWPFVVDLLLSFNYLSHMNIGIKVSSDF